MDQQWAEVGDAGVADIPQAHRCTLMASLAYDTYAVMEVEAASLWYVEGQRVTTDELYPMFQV